MARALDDGTIVHCLDVEAGDIVILDNWRTLHMRPDFKPRWDGYDRWLRVYAAERVMRGVSTSNDWPVLEVEFTREATLRRVRGRQQADMPLEAVIQCITRQWRCSENGPRKSGFVQWLG